MKDAFESAIVRLSAVCLFLATLCPFGTASAESVRRVSPPPENSVTPFETIHAAYDDGLTTTADDLRCVAELFQESLLFDRPIEIALSGGYDFTSNEIVGMTTFYSLTITAGSVSISNFIFGPVTCIPQSCADRGINCHYASDGCGYLIYCGMCEVPGEFCGGGGFGICGTTLCIPQTCADQGINCGFATDGCGSYIDCGPCPPGQICGGGGFGICM